MNSQTDSPEPPEIEANQVKLVPINRIIVADGRRPLDEHKVAELMDSIQEVDLLQPILVAPRKAEDGSEYLHLVAGRHRLEAVKRIGLATVKCTILQQDGPLRVQLAEVDENLVRADLSAAQHALLTGRRKEIIKQLAAENGTLSQLATASKQSQRRAGQKTGPESGSVRDEAARTGASKDTIQRSNRRFEALGSALLTSIVGTSLDIGVELDALAKLPEEHRRELAERAAAGDKISTKTKISSKTGAPRREPRSEVKPQKQPPEQTISAMWGSLLDWAIDYCDLLEACGLSDQVNELEQTLFKLAGLQPTQASSQKAENSGWLSRWRKGD